ncbi:MAG: 50S ribosomal protein L9 [Anaerolineales bacterium]|nr:50S ribosomal protein L9 [Anaerolineales bacterium]
MKILLLKDVYKLGRAGDVKKVAAGYGRNYLIPQGLAVLATPGALKQAEYIREKATTQRDALNKEMSDVVEKMQGLVLNFSAKASETDKLYGSITTHMIAESLSEKLGMEIVRRQIDSQPLRNIGVHNVPVRLTVDLVPEISVIVYREGESPQTVLEEYESEAAEIALETEAEVAQEIVEVEVETLEMEAETQSEAGEQEIEQAVAELEETEESETETPEE